MKRIGKYKQLVVGIIIGSLLSIGGTVFADNTLQVSAWIKKGISFEFNGKAKKILRGDHILFYENRTYVPIDYIAQNLGANVAWDETRQVIQITQKENTKSKSNYEKPAEGEYKNFPIKKMIGDAIVTVKNMSLEHDHTKIFLKVKNLGEKDVLLDQKAAEIRIDSKIYPQKKIVDKLVYPFDQTWFNNIREDEEKEGVIKLPPIDKNAENMILTLKVIQNDASQKETLETFYIKLKK